MTFLAAPIVAGGALTWGTAISVGAGVLGGLSQMSSAKAAEQQANYNAQLQERQAQYNQQSAEIEASRIERATADQAAERRRILSTEKATQRAAYASAGIAVDEGTPLSIMEATIAQGEKDILAINDKGIYDAWATREQGRLGVWNGATGAALTRYEGQQKATAGRTQALGSFATAATRLA